MTTAARIVYAVALVIYFGGFAGFVALLVWGAR